VLTTAPGDGGHSVSLARSWLLGVEAAHFAGCDADSECKRLLGCAAVAYSCMLGSLAMWSCTRMQRLCSWRTLVRLLGASSCSASCRRSRSSARRAGNQARPSAVPSTWSRWCFERWCRRVLLCAASTQRHVVAHFAGHFSHRWTKRDTYVLMKCDTDECHKYYMVRRTGRLRRCLLTLWCTVIRCNLPSICG
jgi:hypothetical protein